MHLSAALAHLHCPVHMHFLQRQAINSRHDLDASGRMVQRGCPPVVSYLCPASIRWLWHFWIHDQCLVQQLARDQVCLMCCLSAAWVGGMLSKVLHFWKSACFLPSLTSVLSLVRSYTSTKIVLIATLILH